MVSGADVEIQLTDAINLQADNTADELAKFNGLRFDSVDFYSYLDATTYVAKSQAFQCLGSLLQKTHIKISITSKYYAAKTVSTSRRYLDQTTLPPA